MTVSEMTPMQLYAVVMAALVCFALAREGLRFFNTLEETKPKIVAAFGLAALVGLPMLIAFDVMAV